MTAGAMAEWLRAIQTEDEECREKFSEIATYLERGQEIALSESGFLPLVDEALSRAGDALYIARMEGKEGDEEYVWIRNTGGPTIALGILTVAQRILLAKLSVEEQDGEQ